MEFKDDIPKNTCTFCLLALTTEKEKELGYHFNCRDLIISNIGQIGIIGNMYCGKSYFINKLKLKYQIDERIFWESGLNFNSYEWKLIIGRNMIDTVIIIVNTTNTKKNKKELRDEKELLLFWSYFSMMIRVTRLKTSQPFFI